MSLEQMGRMGRAVINKKAAVVTQEKNIKKIIPTIKKSEDEKKPENNQNQPETIETNANEQVLSNNSQVNTADDAEKTLPRMQSVLHLQQPHGDGVIVENCVYNAPDS